LFIIPINLESDEKSGEDSDEKSDEESDEKSGEESDEKSDEESDEKSGEDSDEKSGEDSDEKSGEESDEKSDEESAEKSDEELLKKIEKILNVLSKNERCFEIKDLNKHQRHLVHNLVENRKLGLFHFTKRGILFLSNCESDRATYNKYAKLRQLFKQKEDKIELINEKLSYLKLTSVQRKSLAYEISSLNSQKTSQNSKDLATEVSNTVSRKISCHVCAKNGLEKLCVGEKGLNLHLVKFHKIKRN
jgi:hypothetical protein